MVILVFPSAIGAGVMNRTQERFNKIRHEQAQNKKAKRENQRDEPAPPLQNDNDLRRRQQDKPMPLFINKDNQKNGNKRREQQESMNGNDVKSASVESNANNYSKQPQKHHSKNIKYEKQDSEKIYKGRHKWLISH